MSDTLRDQLLGLGFKPTAPARPEKRDERRPPRPNAPKQGERRDAGRPGPRPEAARDAKPKGRPPSRNGGPRRPRTQEEIDLGKAYALRAQKEKDERIAAEAARQEEARQRREARARLGDFLKDKALNDKDADIARHFPYGGKIKRIYVTAEQLRALNAGELGVVQLDGRYVLVAKDVLDAAEAIFQQAVALRVDPDAPAGDDPYSDPQYQVPDDLVW
ncbi:DUF2058 domain-containing protein [Cognatilysobacter segetis]|uniref:DUF2058 domain-containing protein n=2 Tax=Cognatilysobacter segetis TaxID=2492394 RepID=UPI0010605B8D|nr:DUF2058 family protein [Lysobacter segetis]